MLWGDLNRPFDALGDPLGPFRGHGQGSESRSVAPIEIFENLVDLDVQITRFAGDTLLSSM